MSVATETVRAQHKPLSSGALLFLAAGFGHVANFVFQRLMAQMFGAQHMGEFGVMNTMLNVFGLVALPANALQLSIARQIAMLEQKGDSDTIAAMLHRAVRRLAVLCPLAVLVLLVLSPWLKRYLRLDHYGPVFVTAGLIVVTLVLPVGNGALQGLKRFGWLSVAGVAMPLVRIAVGVWLVFLGWRASGALLGSLAGSVLIGGLCVAVLAPYFRRPVAFREADTSMVYRHLGPTLVSLICYAGLVNLDLLFVKHYFAAEAAAQYAAASRFGQAIGWMITPLCTVLFPHVWDESRGEANRSLLFRFLMAAIAIGVAAGCVCSVGRAFFSQLLLGRADAMVAWLIPRYVWAMLPIGVANLFLNFVLARGRFGFLAAFILVVLLYMAAFVVWHDTLSQVLAVVAGFGTITLGLFAAVTYLVGRPGDKA